MVPLPLAIWNSTSRSGSRMYFTAKNRLAAAGGSQQDDVVMLQDVVAGAEPQQFLLLQPSVRQILHILQTGSWVREGIVVDRDADAYCVNTVHLLKQVDEADLLQLMDKEEAAKYLESTEPTEPEPVMVTPKPEEKEQPTCSP